MNTRTSPRFGAMRDRPCGCTLQYGLSGGTGSWAVTLPCARHRNEVNQLDYASRGWYAPYDDQRILVRELHAWQAARIEPAHGGRSWAVTDGENDVLDSGWTATEDEAKAAVRDWAEDDLLCDELAGQIADDVLSEAFSALGHGEAALAGAERVVARTRYL